MRAVAKRSQTVEFRNAHSKDDESAILARMHTNVQNRKNEGKS